MRGVFSATRARMAHHGAGLLVCYDASTPKLPSSRESVLCLYSHRRLVKELVSTRCASLRNVRPPTPAR